MSSVVPVMVDCWRDGKLLVSYEMGYARTLGPTVPPPDEGFITEAKDNLTNAGLARPPYEGISFKVRR
jgi:hypothetical protein